MNDREPLDPLLNCITAGSTANGTLFGGEPVQDIFVARITGELVENGFGPCRYRGLSSPHGADPMLIVHNCLDVLTVVDTLFPFMVPPHVA